MKLSYTTYHIRIFLERNLTDPISAIRLDLHEPIIHIFKPNHRLITWKHLPAVTSIGQQHAAGQSWRTPFFVVNSIKNRRNQDFWFSCSYIEIEWMKWTILAHPSMWQCHGTAQSTQPNAALWVFGMCVYVLRFVADWRFSQRNSDRIESSLILTHTTLTGNS